MKRIFTISYLFLVVSLSSCRQNSYKPYNLDFERVNSGQSLPDRWVQWGDNDFSVKTDEDISYRGKYSIKVSSGNGRIKNRSAGFFNAIPVMGKSGEITLEGYIKTEAVANGFAGLVLQIDLGDKILDYRDMHEQQLTGTHNWKKYSVTAPYHQGITQIFIGGTLSGTGLVWFDTFDVLISNVSIRKLKPLAN